MRPSRGEYAACVANERPEEIVQPEDSAPPAGLVVSAGSHRTSEARREVLREAVTMVLYVSVVLIAELAAIPEEHFADGRVTGAVGGQLLAIVWGTAVGLAVAHWFSFGLAAPAFRGERLTRSDTYIGFAQTGSAML